MTVTPALPPSALQPYANARILLFSNAIPGVLDSQRTGRFLFEGFLRRLARMAPLVGLPRFRGQISGLRRGEFRGRDELLFVDDRTEVADR